MSNNYTCYIIPRWVVRVAIEFWKTEVKSNE